MMVLGYLHRLNHSSTTVVGLSGTLDTEYGLLDHVTATKLYNKQC